MSSFVVAPKTINGIITFLDNATSGNTIHRYGYRGLLAKYLITPNDESALGDDEKNLQKLASAFWDMNIEAVYQRCGDDSLDKMPGSYENQKLVHHAPYQYVEVSPIQAYKSVQCLTYQCAEGNVPNQPLYKFLEELESEIAKHIVSALPEYDRAVWG